MKRTTMAGEATQHLPPEHEVMGREMLLSIMDAAVARWQADPARGYALMQIEFEGLERIKNGLGHAAADRFMRLAWARLCTLAEPVLPDEVAGQHLAILGCGTLAVFLDGSIDSFAAVDIAHRLLQQMEMPFDLGESKVVSTVNIGVVLSGMGHRKGEEILRAAGSALWQAKRTGRSTIVVWDMPMHLRDQQCLRLEMDIREALDRGEFEVFYQPIVELPSRRLKGFEALARWRHPRRGWVLPGEFIPIAEETGLIDPLGRQIARQAMKQLSSWRADLPESSDLTISINLSLAQLLRPTITDTIGAAIVEAGIPARSVCLEVTESVLMRDRRSVARTLADLRALGLQLAIDDFGTGHSSLACLHEFPLDILKIDRAFIGQISLHPRGETVIKAILAIARDYGLRTIAEGIESADEEALMNKFRCDFGQGYRFGRPMPAQDSARMLASIGKAVLPQPRPTDRTVIGATCPA